MKNKDDLPESNRRDFLKNASLAALMAMAGEMKLRAEQTAQSATSAAAALTKITPPPPVNFGVIGLNDWGREILRTLALMPHDPVPSAPVVALCDHHPNTLRRAAKD